MTKINDDKIVKGNKIITLKSDNNSSFSDSLHRFYDLNKNNAKVIKVCNVVS